MNQWASEMAREREREALNEPRTKIPQHRRFLAQIRSINRFKPQSFGPFFFGFSFFVKECGSLFVQLWGLNFVCAYQKAFFWIKIKLIKLQALGLRFRFRLALGSVLGSGLCFGIPAKRVQLKSCNKIVFNLIWLRRQPEPFSRLLSFYALLTRHLPCSSLC